MMIRTSLALIPLMALVACGQAPQSGETKPAPEAAASKDTTPSVAPAAAPATPAPAAGPSPEDAKILAGLPAPYNEGDLANGRRQFAKCRSCHVIEKGGDNRVGPALHGVFGRTAGTAAGFNYSPALKGAGFVWDAGKLDQWLADPKGFLPGNRMTFVGLKQEKDRRDVIAYIKVESAK
ncbi:MAG: c-type cytochrome [Hyphomonadaceae bacterium]|jgi:cytochrome c|uniref:c-type cytochrome n=1 Tax=Aquidulcibacter sp. TaxID=2052990 RepID=UPI0022CCF917|nr:cytochrome c family protein [Aquidulcibacter sp.]MCE2891736.1 cytochrome c family protein [Hyphomonadaceae bacterium]MCZ8209676.1 cytochrome c family protein [Aquidulcibacter sp.]